MLSLGWVIASICVLVTYQHARASPLEIVAVPHYPPYSSKNMEHFGFSTEIVETAFERAGYKTEIILLPWTRGLKAVKSGRYDALPNAWYRQSRTKTLYYSAPHGRTKLVFASRSQSPFHFQNLDNIKGKTVALVRGYSYPDYIRKNDSITKVKTDNLKSSLRMLARGRVDLALGDRTVMMYFLRHKLKRIREKIHVGSQSVKIETIHVAVSRKTENYKKIVTNFNNALESMKESGLYDRIMADHGFPTYRRIRE